MLSHLRCATSRSRTCSRPLLRQATGKRSIYATRVVRSDLAPEPADAAEQEEEPSQSNENGAPRPKAEETNLEYYNDFMQTIGAEYKKADAPRKWLGGKVVESVPIVFPRHILTFGLFFKPFPMNPSFKPPPPVSDMVRTAIYHEFMRDPVANSVRVLSQRYHLSLKRVDAILRLKGLEESWKQGKQLETGFHLGMETLLGVSTPPSTEAAIQLRYDTHAADMLEQDENRDAARQRYQRMYWESVPEDGREPILPLVLEQAKARGKRNTASLDVMKSHPKLMPRFKDTETIKTPKEKVQTVEKPGHVAVKIIDVGGRLMDVNERLQRMTGSERRARQKASKAARGV